MSAGGRPGFFHDEQGSRSSGRLCWWAIVVPMAVVFPVVDVFTSRKVPPEVYQHLALLIVVVGAWVIGPRTFQYLLPQLGALFGRLSSAVGSWTSGPVRREDDER